MIMFVDVKARDDHIDLQLVTRTISTAIVVTFFFPKPSLSTVSSVHWIFFFSAAPFFNFSLKVSSLPSGVSVTVVVVEVVLLTGLLLAISHFIPLLRSVFKLFKL